ncbi:hypothetical protein QYF36_010240 [Acer negundo]|nr:hypothetical protein QYF36_010240 [Acer negundo]
MWCAAYHYSNWVVLLSASGPSSASPHLILSTLTLIMTPPTLTLIRTLTTIVNMLLPLLLLLPPPTTTLILIDHCK